MPTFFQIGPFINLKSNNMRKFGNSRLAACICIPHFLYMSGGYLIVVDYSVPSSFSNNNVTISLNIIYKYCNTFSESALQKYVENFSQTLDSLYLKVIQ